MHAGQDVVLTKWAALSGTLEIVRLKEEELQKRFAPFFIKQIKVLEDSLLVREEEGLEQRQDVSFVREVGEGGIFAALWRLSGEAGTGITVDMKRISIRQETIEVCEYYRLNPYQLLSDGSFLIVADDGRMLVEELKQKGIHASLIGRLTDSNDKILRNGEEIRYIDRPAPDEIGKTRVEN